MGNRCARCGKTYMRGNLVSHSKQRTHRLFRPNLHKFQGKKYCTKCLRIIKKAWQEARQKKVEPTPQPKAGRPLAETEPVGSPA